MGLVHSTWCESCARKSNCYVTNARPKCFVPLTNTTVVCPKCGRTDYIREFGKDFSVSAEKAGYKYKCINCNTYIEQTEPNSSEKPNNCDDEPQIEVIACPLQEENAEYFKWLYEDEPQTERHLPDYSYEADLGKRIMKQTMRDENYIYAYDKTHGEWYPIREIEKSCDNRQIEDKRMVQVKDIVYVLENHLDTPEAAGILLDLLDYIIIIRSSNTEILEEK